MFADPLSTLMAMFFLCFIGMLIMFLFVIRALSDVSSSLREVTRKQSVGFAELEQQLMEISFTKRESTSQKVLPLATEADAPDIMTDSELSSLLTSIGNSRTVASESLLPFDREDEMASKKESSSLTNIFDASNHLEQHEAKSNDWLQEESFLRMEPKYK